MRFTNVIVALFAAASVYSKAAISKSDLAAYVKTQSADCVAELNKYQACFINPSSKKACKVIKGKACASFYADPKKYLGHCVGNDKVDLFNQAKLNEIKAEYKQVCKKIENKKKNTKKSTKTVTKTAKKSKKTTKSDAPSAPTATTNSNTPTATNTAGNANTNSTAPTGGALSNVVTSNNSTNPTNTTNPTNSTAPGNNNNVQTSSDATKLTVSLFVTVALVMLTFY